MPRRQDIKKIMIVGSGPIVIGQACEFDYSGTQACKALKEEGYEIVLLNSNPATIMTDPGFADRTYIEPINPDVAEQIIAREKPDVLLPTLGGQTALNLAVALAKNGALARHGVQLIGAQLEAIEKAEDRLLFKKAMEKIGVELPKSGYATSWEEARDIARGIGFPIIIRPSFTMGGEGGGVAYNMEEYEPLARRALTLSPTHTILCEESIIGWKEYELEVMRDKKDNVVIICSIENFDPMGVHTGDSITVAPAQTLTDKEYQRMRDAGIRIIREIGVETGGSNIQFGIHPKTGRMVVIEMNPRVSRSSALASKATGFPIAKIAAKLAVGYTLDEIQNDITRYTPASFEPTIDYVVTKVPRFAFEKFKGADDTLTTQMKSVGEVMAIGRTFQESFQKAIRGLEIDKAGLESPLKKRPGDAYTQAELDQIKAQARVPRAHRLFWLAEGFRAGLTVQDLYDLTFVDPWFLREVEEIVKTEATLAKGLPRDAEAFRAVKRMGFSDKRIAQLAGTSEKAARDARWALGVRPVFKRVDTCAAEFEAFTPYLYSTYEEECEAAPTDKPKVMILGGGPNRIGQGIEFDYCCVHAAFSLTKAGFETIMVNCNPETVSTDYDTSDRLYFEPLTLEDVLEIVHVEKPKGLIVQYGGQTPLKLAVPLHELGVPIFGTAPDAIDRAEDRERFAALIEKLGLRQPQNGVARSAEEAFKVARRIGYPVMVRPSYVLGGRAMEVVYDDKDLETYLREAVQASNERPVLIDRFLRDAAEVDVDVVSDGTRVEVGGVMEHIEEAGIHSGDSACALPPFSLDAATVAEIERQSIAMARELGVIGLMNVQFAIQGKDIYVLEVNPRASRTVPFVGKATGLPLAKAGALCMVGKSLAEAGVEAGRPRPRHTSVKEAVFPFAKFRGVDTVLGPEMRSTGEVMGVSADFYPAFLKAQAAAGNTLPTSGEGKRAFVSVRDGDKEAVVEIARRLVALGFEVLATAGTSAFLGTKGIASTPVKKVQEGRPSIVDRIIDGDVHFVVNTTAGKQEIADSYSIRRETLMKGLPYFTTLTGARAAVGAMESARGGKPVVRSIQEYHSK
ncbi:MAG: carbamoyl-phosphate synthase large subunit [Anaeromyxobacter sp.]